MELLTPEQMRRAEKAAIASGAATGRDLMERAGRGAVATILAAWPELAASPRRAIVLCGPGNNGGDGYVIARLLQDKDWSVAVYALGDPGRLPEDAAANHQLWMERGAIRPFTEVETAEPAELIVDAVFGTGLSRPIDAEVARILGALRDRAAQMRPERPVRVAAIDCPSGLDCATGAVLAPVAEGNGQPARLLDADLTITFHRPKLGHYLNEGPGCCGDVRIADIGLSPAMSDPKSAEGRELVWLAAGPNGAPPDGLAEAVSPDLRHHKYDRGHALILSGGVGKGGAARLAARAALRAGAGLATLSCPPAALIENAARLDAVMLRAAKDAEALGEILEDKRITAICAGPGMGVSDRTREMVGALLAPPSERTARRRVVLDADALTSFADDPDALFAQLHPGCLLTPHEGEFARLFSDLSERTRGGRRMSKPDAARAAADRAGCTILLKGPDTVIASPGGRTTLHAAAYARAAPWLGTAGAGDVLAGIATGLMARGPGEEPPHDLAVYAAWLHVEAARAFGPGLIAEDLPEMLPRVFRDLGL